MIRPCFLVIDKRYPGSISARKLVIETALLERHHRLQCRGGHRHAGARFPAVDGIVLDTEVKGITCRDLIRRLRAVRSDLPIVTVSPSGHDPCGAEDFHVSSYDPQDLLEQLNRICPKETREAAEESDFPR
jgi:DNA-binding response OmpR family regulator